MMLMCTISLVAQEHFPKNDGVKSENTNYTAFTNAKIYVIQVFSSARATGVLKNVDAIIEKEAKEKKLREEKEAKE